MAPGTHSERNMSDFIVQTGVSEVSDNRKTNKNRVFKGFKSAKCSWNTNTPPQLPCLFIFSFCDLYIRMESLIVTKCLDDVISDSIESSLEFFEHFILLSVFEKFR